jgi:hypothetical protein
MRHFVAAAILALFSALPSTPVGRGVIEGSVTDTALSPLDQVTGSLVGTALSFRTQTSGRFRVTDAPAGEYTLLLRRVGYSELTVRVEVRSSDTTRLAIQLTPVDPRSAGIARYHVLVRDRAGRPIANARVRLLGRNTSRSDADGAVTFDSIASGRQTLEVLSIGYQPELRSIDVGLRREATDTVVLESLMLDTVRVTATRDPTGFELRRTTRKGQFITAADVASENPVNTTHLLRTRDGLRYTFSRNGLGFIEVTTLDRPCLPLILVDGFPPGAAPPAPGRAALDWIIHPDEIGGIEIYTNPGQIPAEFSRFASAPCAAIVFWTRERFGLPKPNPM